MILRIPRGVCNATEKASSGAFFYGTGCAKQSLRRVPFTHIPFGLSLSKPAFGLPCACRRLDGSTGRSRFPVQPPRRQGNAHAVLERNHARVRKMRATRWSRHFLRCTIDRDRDAFPSKARSHFPICAQRARMGFLNSQTAGAFRLPWYRV